MTRTTTPCPVLRRALAGAVALLWASTATAAPLGFYKQDAKPAIYLQYRTDVYCQVQNMDQMNAFGGMDKVKIVAQLQLSGRQTGTCGWPNGFYKRSNDSKVYRAFGNGVGWAGIGDRLCHVVNERQMAAYGGFQKVRVVQAGSELGRGRAAPTPCPNP
jgi:hypothetical protein